MWRVVGIWTIILWDPPWKRLGKHCLTRKNSTTYISVSVALLWYVTLDISRISSQVKIGNEWLICFLNVAVCIRRRKKKTLEIWNRLKGNGTSYCIHFPLSVVALAELRPRSRQWLFSLYSELRGALIYINGRTDGRYSTHYRKNKHFNKANNQLTHGSVKLKWNHQTQTNQTVPSLL